MINIFYFPTAWKTANVIPLIKKGKDPHHPSSYRYLIHFAHKLKRILDNQFGFGHQHSTVHAIHQLLNDTYKYLNEGKLVGATLIDLEKAFDSAWINGLITTLHN